MAVAKRAKYRGLPIPSFPCHEGFCCRAPPSRGSAIASRISRVSNAWMFLAPASENELVLWELPCGGVTASLSATGCELTEISTSHANITMRSVQYFGEIW